MGPSAWDAKAVGDSSWIVQWTAPQLAALERATAHARATGKPLASLTAADVPLPELAAALGSWRDELDRGRGFVLLRGLPVHRWSPDEVKIAYWVLGQHLGRPGAQNPEGDLLGDVRDAGEDPGEQGVRLYKTAAPIGFHCDAADVVGLLCLRTAHSGGRSRLVSSVRVYNELLHARPDLVPSLYAPLFLDTHGEGGLDYFPIEPCRCFEGRLRTFFHSDYFRSGLAYCPGSPERDRTLELLSVYDEIANRPDLYLEMELEPGDIQLVCNHSIVHGRTGYEDDPDPARRRHLLRLWLSLDPSWSAGAALRRRACQAALVARLLPLKIARALRGPAKPQA